MAQLIFGFLVSFIVLYLMQAKSKQHYFIVTMESVSSYCFLGVRRIPPW